MLTALGVDEAEQWLWPELESWESELQDQSNIWKSLHDRADWWLELWISKYKVTTTCFCFTYGKNENFLNHYHHPLEYLSVTKGQNRCLKTERLPLSESALHCCPSL